MWKSGGMVEGERLDGTRVKIGKGVGMRSGQDWVKGLRVVGARVRMGIMDLKKMGDIFRGRSGCAEDL